MRKKSKKVIQEKRILTYAGPAFCWDGWLGALVAVNDWEPWAGMAAWSGFEGCMLIAGFDPHRSEFRLPPWKVDAPERIKPVVDAAWIFGKPPRGIPSGMSLADFNGKRLHDMRVPPRDFLAWAHREGFSVPAGLVKTLEENTSAVAADIREVWTVYRAAEWFVERAPGLDIDDAQNKISKAKSLGKIEGPRRGRVYMDSAKSFVLMDVAKRQRKAENRE